MIEQEDKFLTFNYTGTLEIVYEIEDRNICHIHGQQYEDIYFGHGNRDDKTEFYMRHHIGSENNLMKIHNQLHKNTVEALENNKEFFEGLAKDIIEIYAFGFSFNNVDMIYLNEIFKKIDTNNIDFYLHDFDKRQHESYIGKIKECGFMGNTKSFHI